YTFLPRSVSKGGSSSPFSGWWSFTQLTMCSAIVPRKIISQLGAVDFADRGEAQKQNAVRKLDSRRRSWTRVRYFCGGGVVEFELVGSEEFGVLGGGALLGVHGTLLGWFCALGLLEFGVVFVFEFAEPAGDVVVDVEGEAVSGQGADVDGGG